jgi:uncharacterized protein
VKRISRVVTLAAGAFLLGVVAQGQPQAADTHEAAVRELLQLMEIMNVTIEAADLMLDAQIKHNPQLAPYADILRSFVAKVLQEADIETSLVRLYKEAFSESEVRDMIAFYRTPTGKKAVSKIPELMQKGMSLGTEAAQNHSAELAEMISQRQRELEKRPPAGDKPPAMPPPAGDKPPAGATPPAG